MMGGGVMHVIFLIVLYECSHKNVGIHGGEIDIVIARKLIIAHISRNKGEV